MPAGTQNKTLTPGMLFSDAHADMWVYLGYYQNSTNKKTGYLYAGPLDTPSMAHFGTPTTSDRELMDYGLNDLCYGGVRHAVEHQNLRFTKRPVVFDKLEKTIDYSIISEILFEVPYHIFLGDRK